MSEQMTIDQAIAILNRENWRGYQWESYGDFAVPVGEGLQLDWFTHREARYICEGIERDREHAEREQQQEPCYICEGLGLPDCGSANAV